MAHEMQAEGSDAAAPIEPPRPQTSLPSDSHPGMPPSGPPTTASFSSAPPVGVLTSPLPSPAGGGPSNVGFARGGMHPGGSTLRPEPKKIQAAASPFGVSAQSRPTQQPISAMANPFGAQPK